MCSNHTNDHSDFTLPIGSSKYNPVISIFSPKTINLFPTLLSRMFCKIETSHTTSHVCPVLVRSYGEIDILYAKDLTVFIHCHNRFSRHQYCHIDEIDCRLCYKWFGLSPYDMHHLYAHWHVPIIFQTSSRQIFQGEETFIVFLYHLMKGNPFTEMARQTFGGDPRHLSKMFDSMNDHLYNLLYNKIYDTSLCQWIPSQIHLC